MVNTCFRAGFHSRWIWLQHTIDLQRRVGESCHLSLFLHSFMLPDAAKHPALPQGNLHMPSKSDVPITHVLAICTVHVQEVQRAAFCLGFPGQRNRSCISMHLHHITGVWPHIWPACWELSPAPEHSWLQLQVCLFVVECSPFSSSQSVSAGIDLHLTYLLEPRQTGEVIALYNCNHVKGLWVNPLTYSIIPSLKWFALLWAGRPELPEHHTHLSGEMRQRKRGQWVSMPLTCCRALKPVIAYKTHSLPSTRSPLSASALHLLAGGSLLAFVTTSKREMGTPAKSHTTESTTHATETGFLHFLCIIWETLQPPDIFW